MTEPKSSRTLGADLTDHDAKRIFDDFVASAHLKPKELFRCKLQPVKGYTSDWQAVNRYFYIINEIVDALKGRIPNHASLARQFQDFLDRRKVTWSYRDTDDSVSGLRSMMQSLLQMKRDRKPAPKGYDRFTIILEKLIVERNECRSRSPRLRSPSEPRRTRARPSIAPAMLPLPLPQSHRVEKDVEEDPDLAALEQSLFIPPPPSGATSTSSIVYLAPVFAAFSIL